MVDLDKQLQLNPDATFLESKEGSLTYGEVDRLVSVRARVLGDRTGHRVVVRPLIDTGSVVEILAAGRAGATAVAVAADLPHQIAARQVEAAAREERPCQTILFTSGSSGAPKGVRLTASNWDAAATISINRLGHGPQSRWLCPLPLHHVGGLSIIYRTIAAGGSVVLAPGPNDLSAWMGRVQFASLVPTQLYRTLAGRTDRFTNMPVVLIGGGPSEPGLLDQADAAGLVVLPTYGMTESTSQAATARPGDPDRRLFPLDGVEVRVGPDGRIHLRGPTISPGYVGEPERSAGDWLATADRGRVEPDGSLVVLGRLERLIISGGENIDPSAIEEAIRSHPEVVEVAVIGLPDREWGEIAAVVYVGGVEAEQLGSFIAGLVPPHGLPKRWLRMEALPRTPLGKVDTARLLLMFD